MPGLYVLRHYRLSWLRSDLVAGLVLTAVDEYHAQFTTDQYQGFLAECVGMPVRVEAPATAAAGATG